MLNQTLTKQFLDVLMQLPITETYRGRSQLLQGLPQMSIPRDEGDRRLDLSLMVRHIDQLGRLKDTGIRPVMVIARNAYDTLEGWQGGLSGRLEEVIQQLESYYAGETTVSKPLFSLAIEPEKLLLRNRDYRVSLNFLQRAIQAARSVARLQVFVCQQAVRTERAYFGTGSLIAPGLLRTNYHVIGAR